MLAFCWYWACTWCGKWVSHVRTMRMCYCEWWDEDGLRVQWEYIGGWMGMAETSGTGRLPGGGGTWSDFSRLRALIRRRAKAVPSKRNSTCKDLEAWQGVVCLGNCNSSGWQEPWVLVVCGKGDAREADWGQIMPFWILSAQLKTLDFNQKAMGE